MAPRGSLLLLALLLLSCAPPRARGQHWSHGWYPGGKRDLRTPSDLQVGCPPRVTPLRLIPVPAGVMPTPPVSPCPGFVCPPHPVLGLKSFWIIPARVTLPQIILPGLYPLGITSLSRDYPLRWILGFISAPG
uniref:Progonadoliberin n=1 Tax=Geospiza parvula TaxID=87175 RepID=A0A8C3MDP4_GEOPR